MDPQGKAKCSGVNVVHDPLVWAQGVWGEQDPAGYVVKDRQPERVQGTEAQDRGRGAAGGGLVYSTKRREGLVGCPMKR